MLQRRLNLKTERIQTIVKAAAERAERIDMGGSDERHRCSRKCRWKWASGLPSHHEGRNVGGCGSWVKAALLLALATPISFACSHVGVGCHNTWDGGVGPTKIFQTHTSNQGVPRDP